MAKYTFSVFTPTYNRSDRLPIVYESLQKQTFRDFEWLIVDDGSQDTTRTKIALWQKEADFPIRYIYQENQGKHVATNTGVQNAQGELFLIADSDDAFIEQALEVFYQAWRSIEDKEHFSAVTALCMDSNGRIIGDRFPEDICDSDSIEMTYRFHVRGEKWGFHRTEVLKRFLFPHFEGEKFMAESVVWTQIARHFKTRFINVPLRIYGTTNDSLSHNTIALRTTSILGTFYYYDHVMALPIPLYDKLLASINYARFMFHASAVALGFKKSRHAFLIACVLPLGYLVYLRDKWNV
jgi:glycosyltransferase involved in cell wall biosynthesis